jgi:hypothetical protein
VHARSGGGSTIFEQLLRVDGDGADEGGLHGQDAVGEYGNLVSG